MYTPPAIAALRQFLEGAGPGRVKNLDALDERLYRAWPFFGGDASGGMDRSKLVRLEDATWQPPLLTFRIERHGGIVQGGTRAQMQFWTANLNDATASVSDGGYRQLGPRATAVHMGPIVAEIVQLVVSGADDGRLHWSPDRLRVRIILSRCFPQTLYQETLAGRRRRLRDQLVPEMAAAGWRRVAAPATYVRADPPA